MRDAIPKVAAIVLSFALVACNRVEVHDVPAARLPTGPAAVSSAEASDLALSLSLDDRFRPSRRDARTVVLRVDGVPDVELWLVVGRDPVDGPAPTLEAIIAKARAFLEPIHGELDVTSMPNGNSLLSYEGPRVDGNRTLHTVNWMLVRSGNGAILRADVSLRAPGPWAGSPLIEGLSAHVNERLQEARFEPDS